MSLLELNYYPETLLRLGEASNSHRLFRNAEGIKYYALFQSFTSAKALMKTYEKLNDEWS
jgi:hypothetical protein